MYAPPASAMYPDGFQTTVELSKLTAGLEGAFRPGHFAGVCTVVLVNDNAVVNTSLAGTVSTLAGSLCVRVYDTGALTESVNFTFTVTHP